MNFWKNKKQLIQMRTEILHLEAENEQLISDKNQLKYNLKCMERQNAYLSRIMALTHRDEAIVKTFFQDQKLYAVTITTVYNYKGQLTEAHFYLYRITKDVSSSQRNLNHIWLKPQYREESDLERLEYVEIIEFVGRGGELGKGYGSLNLSVMLEFVKEAFGEKTTIKGWLSPFDERSENNKNRRNHVYEKFGFKFEEGWVVLDDLSNLEKF
ncbi:hypothetical protein [Lactococcus petauri]|uniref:hypothetical protein n=1 Tax=Lactococcus petauri TaxID=1940789 RepID=UPI001F57AF93|nr:hypothetical protein [Lactococcus petauri]